jgi:hypothetical protein
MENASDKSVEKIKTPILYAITFFFENRAIYEVMRKNAVQPDGSQMAIWRMGILCWIPKSTNTSTKYVLLFAGFIWLRIRKSSEIFEHWNETLEPLK